MTKSSSLPRNPVRSPPTPTGYVKRRGWSGSSTTASYPLHASSTCLPVSIQHFSDTYFCITNFNIPQDLDRSNLGNARLQGLPEDILGGDKTGALFDWVNSAFFFSYVSPSTRTSTQSSLQLNLTNILRQILCQIPATVISKLFQPRIWMATAAIGWGLSSTLMVCLFFFLFIFADHNYDSPPVSVSVV